MTRRASVEQTAITNKGVVTSMHCEPERSTVDYAEKMA